MRKVLVAVDGSPNALRAVQHVLADRDAYREPLHAVLVNVQPPVVSGAVKTFLSQEQITHYYHDEGEKALAEARALVEKAGVGFECHILVGEIAPTIAKFARETGCALIVMGTRGLGSVSGLFLGSVATKVVHLSDVPVLLLK
jgi:nucleotide-binding universal stress UspA family protein